MPPGHVPVSIDFAHATTPILPRRPGSNPKMVAKAATLPADMVFIDLEDAVAPLEKNDATRQNVVDALTGHEWTAKTRVVRVNGIDTTWCFRDILYVVAGAQDALDCIMLPKVQGPDHVPSRTTCSPSSRPSSGMQQAHRARGADRERPRRREPAAIADASDRIETIIFGPGDYAADLGIPQLSVGAIDERLPGRPVALHPLAHRHHGAGARPAGHRRPVLGDPRPRRASARSPSARCGSASTASGPCTPTRSRSSTRSTARPGAVRPRRGAARRLPRGDRRRPPRRRHVGGRDDRRGLAQDGRAGRRARPRGRHAAAPSDAARAPRASRGDAAIQAAAATDTWASTRPTAAGCATGTRRSRPAAEQDEEREGESAPAIRPRAGRICRTSSSTAAMTMNAMATRTCTYAASSRLPRRRMSSPPACGPAAVVTRR